MSHQNPDSELIDRLGGTVKVAMICGITTGAVSQWRTNGMPKPWKLFFRTKSPKVFRAWELSVGETATASPLGVGHA
ncbi:helix-turn-helix domain-containing protein [Bordetella bronchiseptica]|uniref:hypothetical protein n=1 Tax=Bordetella bronchiseptica TaxID=518 RepID=UPI000528C1B0|nr:hypothetical protein [Bordetella bronchiseptica]WLS60412.1 hypothetical protein RAK14_06965 [Bordetella bronchiseptica]WLS65246.1 hypothetical protein RAK11_06965 [Bordetella bronchiseptica]SHT49666.1 Uncharacterised protein [Mycobacteroides abscessus subsp. abscessus]